MILYKYVPFESGKKILETSTLGFSQPKYFNDPFDMPSYPSAEVSGESFDGIIDFVRMDAKATVWADNTGILSLTRTPTNPLMWAHYADKHRGMVIGIDVQAAGLTQEDSNLVPAQYGSVIYVSGRPNQAFMAKITSGLAVGATHSFPHDHYEKLQRLFLHKPLCWSYEEEVRVLKCLKGIEAEGSETPSGRFRVAKIGGQPLYLYSVPADAIREVYFGFRLEMEDADGFYYFAKERLPHLRVLECHLKPDRFEVGVSDYITIAEHTSG